MAGPGTLGGMPSLQSQWFDENGRPASATVGFFNSLVAPAGPVSAVPLDQNAMYYVAPSAGTLHISGGSISAIKFTRGRTTLNMDASATLIPVAQNDIVEIDFTAGPEVNFLPS